MGGIYQQGGPFNKLEPNWAHEREHVAKALDGAKRRGLTGKNGNLSHHYRNVEELLDTDHKRAVVEYGNLRGSGGDTTGMSRGRR